LLARAIIGLALAAHGSQKLFGWFGGYGIKGTGGFFESLGFRPGALFATLAGLSEFFGGLFVLAGFAGPIGPALIISTMLVAIFTVHLSKGFWNSNGGWELPATNIAAAIAFATLGYGAISVDANVPALAVLHQPAVVWSVLGLSVIGAIGNLLVRKTAAAKG
jgi:putative oxidoreductase